MPGNLLARGTGVTFVQLGRSAFRSGALPPVAATVAVSLGSQSCSLVLVVESWTVKHSLWLESLEPV